MGVLGDRWSLLILRDVIFNGYARYGEFLESGEGISTTVLADRLARLEQNELLIKTPELEDALRTKYLITPKGIDLIPVILQFIIWAEKYDKNTLVTPSRAAEISADPEAARVNLIKKITDRGGF